jgi:putative transposase
VQRFSTLHALLGWISTAKESIVSRPKLEQADWHITARGARRLLLFHDDSDYKVFYALLGEACRHFEVSLIADCLMSNHFHLSLSGGTRLIGRCMQRLNRGYSGYHNERYRLSGHAFDRVYYGEPIHSTFILKRVIRYIHLNPVRAGRVAGPDQFPWSSYRRLISSPQYVAWRRRTSVPYRIRPRPQEGSPGL